MTIDITTIGIGTKLIGDRGQGRTSEAIVSETGTDHIGPYLKAKTVRGEEFTVSRVDSADSGAIGWRLAK